MLVLTRKKGEAIRIGPDIFVTFLASRSNSIHIGVEAPKEVPILRTELISNAPEVGAMRVPKEGR